MFLKKSIIYLIIVACLLPTLLIGCTKVKDRDTTVDVDTLDINLTNVISKSTVFTVNQVYDNVKSMVVDAKYIVEGTIQNIEYFVDENNLTPRTKIDLLVSKSYSGNIKPDTTISIIEHQGYIPIKFITDGYFKETGKNHPLYTEDDIKNGVLKYDINHGKFSEVGDQCLYFLINIETPYSDTNVYSRKSMDDLSPQGAYKPIGILMGKFTLNILDDSAYYRRNNFMYHSSKDPKKDGAPTRLLPIIPKDELISDLEECLKSK
jgi:hypothetical protein